MVVPPKTISDIPKSERWKLIELLHEKSVIGYAFSFRHLLKYFKITLISAGKPAADAEEIAINRIQACILATKEKCSTKQCGVCEKCIETELNDKIMKLYTENGIEKTIRHSDPFGTQVDYCMMEGTGTSFSKDKAMSYAVRKGLLTAEQFAEVYEAGVSKSSYVTVSAKEVKLKDVDKD